MRVINQAAKLLFKPMRLLTFDRRGVISVKQDQRQIVAKIQSGKTMVGIKAIKQRVVVRRLLTRSVVSTFHFMVANARYERN